MKKIRISLLTAVLAILLTACANGQENEQTKKTDLNVAETSSEKGQQKDNAKITKETLKDKSKKNKETKQKEKKSSEEKSAQTKKTAKKKNASSVKKRKKTTTQSEKKQTNAADKEIKKESKEKNCSFLISCKTVLKHKDDLQSNYRVPSNGEIYRKTIKIQDGETVMDVLKKTGVDFDSSKGYVSGIDGLYEFDCGKNSGWMYKVNGTFPNVAAGDYLLSDGDRVEWLYTCVRGDI